MDRANIHPKISELDWVCPQHNFFIPVSPYAIEWRILGGYARGRGTRWLPGGVRGVFDPRLNAGRAYWCCPSCEYWNGDKYEVRRHMTHSCATKRLSDEEARDIDLPRISADGLDKKPHPVQKSINCTSGYHTKLFPGLGLSLPRSEFFSIQTNRNRSSTRTICQTCHDHMIEEEEKEHDFLPDVIRALWGTDIPDQGAVRGEKSLPFNAINDPKFFSKKKADRVDLWEKIRAQRQRYYDPHSEGVWASLYWPEEALKNVPGAGKERATYIMVATLNVIVEERIIAVGGNVCQICGKFDCIVNEDGEIDENGGILLEHGAFTIDKIRKCNCDHDKNKKWTEAQCKCSEKDGTGRHGHSAQDNIGFAHAHCNEVKKDKCPELLHSLHKNLCRPHQYTSVRELGKRLNRLVDAVQAIRTPEFHLTNKSMRDKMRRYQNGGEDPDSESDYFSESEEEEFLEDRGFEDIGLYQQNDEEEEIQTSLKSAVAKNKRLNTHTDHVKMNVTNNTKIAPQRRTR